MATKHLSEGIQATGAPSGKLVFYPGENREKNSSFRGKLWKVTNETAEGTSGFVVYVHKELFLAALAEVIYMVLCTKNPTFFFSTGLMSWND